MAQLGLGTRCVQAGYSPKNGEPRQIPICFFDFKVINNFYPIRVSFEV